MGGAFLPWGLVREMSEALSLVIVIAGYSALVLCGLMPLIDWLFFPAKPGTCALCDSGHRAFNTHTGEHVHLGRSAEIIRCTKRRAA